MVTFSYAFNTVLAIAMRKKLGLKTVCLRGRRVLRFRLSRVYYGSLSGVCVFLVIDSCGGYL